MGCGSHSGTHAQRQADRHTAAMGLIGKLLKIGSTARITSDVQGDLPRSVVGKRGTVIGRVRAQDVEGDRAYAVVPQGRKTAKTFWASELQPERKRRKR